MWTSDPDGAPAKASRLTLALEALGLALAFGLLPEMLAAGGGAALVPHPAWIGVLVLAARYGIAGFLAGLAAAVAVVAVASGLAGAEAAFPWSRTASAPDAIALGACLAASWIAAWHARRQGMLLRRLRDARRRAAEAEAIVTALWESAERLRSRADRASASLSFLRDVATRLEGPDPVAAAEAAAELALVRSGATAVAIQFGVGDVHRVLAVRESASTGSGAPRDPRRAEVRVPIPAEGGPVGVLALWGISSPAPDEAAGRDLAVIAAWCGSALRAASQAPRIRAFLQPEAS